MIVPRHFDFTQSYFAGGFQTSLRIEIAKAKNGQGRIISLFFYCDRRKYTVDYHSSRWTDFTCPTSYPLVIPVIYLQLIRHILLVSRVSVGYVCWELVMSLQTFILIVDFKLRISNSQINLLAIILIGARVAVLCIDYVRIQTDGSSIHSFRYFIRNIGQSVEIGQFFLKKNLISATVSFLERCFVVIFKCYRYMVFQCFKGTKPLMS